MSSDDLLPDTSNGLASDKVFGVPEIFGNALSNLSGKDLGSARGVNKAWAHECQFLVSQKDCGTTLYTPFPSRSS